MKTVVVTPEIMDLQPVTSSFTGRPSVPLNGKIINPLVLVHKRENSDSYAVAVTSVSTDYEDALLIASMKHDLQDERTGTWSQTGYYMAAEIERLRRLCEHNQKTITDLIRQLNVQQQTSRD